MKCDKNEEEDTGNWGRVREKRKNLEEGGRVVGREDRTKKKDKNRDRNL
jgi:hypothetical protein